LKSVRFLLLPLALFSLTLGGCKKIEVQPLSIKTIAVLPFDNETNDLDADDIMQKLVFLALKPSVYEISDITATNERLAKVGIVDGGQLYIVDPKKLGRDFGVQALMFGYVEDFGTTNVGFYLQRKVSIDLKLVDVGTGATLWENTGVGAVREVHLNKEEAQAAFARGLVNQLTDKLFRSPLESEARIAVVSALSSLPGFVFHGFPRENDAKNLIKDLINKK
jgi:hypothetical protein